MRKVICSISVVVMTLICYYPTGSSASSSAVSDGQVLMGSVELGHEAFAQSKTTIYVDDDNTTGPWDGTLEHPYQYIQDGIDSASWGDHIYVLEGTYYEHISVDKFVHLVGEGKSSTIIDGSNAGDVVTINVDYVNMTGFTVQNSGSSTLRKGINVRSNYCTIIDNIIQNNYYGIHMHFSGTHDNTITHNTMANNGRGISLRISQGNDISCNNFENNSEYGVNLSDDAYNNHVYHNNFINNAQNARELYDNVNFWDDGYPSGGNYWSDFDEPAEGAYDDNSDGIVDSSYLIPNGFNEDRYPFIDAYEYPLHAYADGPYLALANEPVQFIGNALGGTEPYSWHWDFGDGDSSMVRNPDHIYRTPGIYIVVLTVTDDDSNSDEDTTTATIEFLADAHGPYEAIVGDTVEFSGDVYGGVPPYDWFWEFDDGDTSDLHNPTHCYTLGGEYTATLTVTDSIGSIALDSAAVHICVPVVWVDDDYDDSTPGWGIDHFDNINDGVYAAAFAGTVYVFNGTYDERVLVDKLLYLVGEDRDSTIVSGTGTGYVVRASANDVSIRGFTVTNGVWGIHLYRIDNAEVDSCILRDNLAGVCIDWSDSNTIDHCNIHNNTNGILLGSDQGNIGNKIFNSNIHHNNEFGIYFGHNYEKSNIVQNNVIAYNGYNGIWMVTAWENEISYNQFFYNDLDAICIVQCMCGGEDNVIHHNDFVLNNGGSVQAHDDLEWGQNYWYSQADHEGNYWSDFENNPGYPYYYEIEGSGSIDLYPFLEPVGDCSLAALAAGPADPEAVCIPVQFTGNAGCGLPPYTWYWDFGDGHDSIEQNPLHDYDEPGIYTVVLTVTDSLIDTANDTIFVTITNILANAQGPSGSEPIYVPIQFIGDVYGGVLPYTWYWEFGDGHDSIEQNPIHSYDQTGIYDVVLTVTDSLDNANADTISVKIVNIHNIDKDTYYGRIQTAINDADPYNTICVSAGTYYEHEITIDRPLYLIGEDRNTTIIDGEGLGGNVIQTSFDSVAVIGFTIKHCASGTDKAGIKIHANYASISDNILLSNGSHGIAFRDGSCYNTISENEIISNSYCGIKLYNDCRYNMIFDNSIHSNGQYGIYFTDSSDSNSVYHNNLTNSSSDNARDECTNIWDDGYPSGGNYWGDYMGSDTLSGPDQNLPGSDGIGDTPYDIPGDGNADRYPLMDSVDYQPPEAIDDLVIFLENGTKSAAGDMRLIWSEPEDDLVVTRYVIYRSTDVGSMGDSLAGTTDTTYLDEGAAGDTGTDHFYTVKAVDASGNKSEQSNQVGEFDKSLIGDE